MTKRTKALRIALATLVCGVLLTASAGVSRVSAQDERGWGGRAGAVRHIRRAPYEVEVLVGGRPLDALYGRGRRYVEAVEGAEYELVLRNPSSARVAVAVSVDGLNTIDARRTSSWEASKWVIEPYGSIRLTGWQMSSRHARRFYFTTERDSYAARLGRAADLGVITAVFYRELAPRPHPVTPPPVYREGREPHSRSEGESQDNSAPQARMKSRGGVTAMPRPDDEHAATGIGRPVDHHVTWVSMDLDRRPAAELTIRYEYRDALVRLGLLPRHRHDDADALRRRERSRGFTPEPGFSPEP